MHHVPLSRAEAGLSLAALGLLALALFGPALALPMAPHGFADQRSWLGIPHVGDVLSNLAFAVAGVWGLARLWRARAAVPHATRASVACFLAGLLCTALGSTVYHWQPDDAGLALDRLGMGVAFAGVLGLAASGRVSQRAGWATGLAMLVASLLAVGVWHGGGDVRAWAVVQFGGMAMVLALAALRPLPGMPAVRLGVLIAWYGLAKLCELADHGILAATAGWVSGHNLKHLLAAAAALPVLAMLQRVAPPLAAGETGRGAMLRRHTPAVKAGNGPC
ncbi:hypothetical protein [Pseudorhodoferax sp.]|uniref:hypothetical protein n=1 Tax=Pseudorhodoferax sp. TaxID=1993553 RepID=UPI002DD687EA|nr:hypothetical protein [Pseudorhodoferax sp.]